MYLDFEKAFHKVSHGKLVEKLTNAGIKGGVLEQIESYLKGRKQKVKIGSSVSSELVVQSGVPQGSVLGPLFIILFINDLPKCVMSACFGYADDYKIIAKNGITLQIDAHKTWKWCSSNLVSLNLKKFKALCLKGITKVTIQGRQLENSIVEKDLGIMISNDVTWTAQTERRREKTMKAFFTIKRNIANGTPWTTGKKLYCRYIVPILSYGAVLRKPSKTDLKSIESIQLNASKWILGTSQLEYKERLRRINLLPLALYHEMHVLLLFIQIVLNTYDLEWQKFVQLEEGKTRMKEIGVFKTRKYFKQKQASDFWMRTVYLANLFGNYCGNVNELQSPKTMVSNV